ncbi:MAG: hypothetical protein AAF197_02835 [Pseudomonadota bacterium]
MLTSSSIKWLGLGLSCSSALALFVLSASFTEAKASRSGNIVTLVSGEGSNERPAIDSRNHYDCSEKIYSVAQLSDYAPGNYHYSVKWIDPTQNVREHTKYDFGVPPTGNTKVWAWLSLSRAPGAKMISWLNPAAGLEEFVGTWKVEVKIDNKLVASNSFEVTC